MPNLAEQHPYFEVGGSFAQRYGTFIPAPVLGKYIIQAINDRDPELLAIFEKSMANLISALKMNEPAQQAFLDVLDEVRADGLVEMVLRKEFHQQYHIVEHAAEVTDDAGEVLTRELKQANAELELEHTIMIALTKACAAWHDVVQLQGSPKNEIESAKLFCKRLDDLLESFKNDFSDLRQSVQGFQEQLSFICNELIIYSTWLVVGMEPGKKLIFKSLNSHTAQVSRDLHEANNYDALIAAINANSFWMLLTKAAEAICRADTRRFDFQHVLNSEVMLEAFNSFASEDKKVLEDFFIQTDMSSAISKEEFLGLSCQNLRIFTELNRPEKPGVPVISMTDISENDHLAFIEACNQARVNDIHNIDFARMFDVFVNTKNKAGKDNLLRELEFAKAQHHALWDRHADLLIKFTRYIRAETFTVDLQARLMKVLMVLATRFQPGNQFLRMDSKFLHKLRLHSSNAAALPPQSLHNLTSALNRYAD